jgi:hypothetical protein
MENGDGHGRGTILDYAMWAKSAEKANDFVKTVEEEGCQDKKMSQVIFAMSRFVPELESF